MTTQHPVTPSVDLRDMVRQNIIKRSLECMENAAERRREALQSGRTYPYIQRIRSTISNFYGDLPVGRGSGPLQTAKVNSFEKDGYRLENVLFDSFPGWQVNATVYVPLDFRPPFPAVIVPVGHSGKQFENYQFPAQFFARSGYLFRPRLRRGLPADRDRYL